MVASLVTLLFPNAGVHSNGKTGFTLVTKGFQVDEDRVYGLIGLMLV